MECRWNKVKWSGNVWTFFPQYIRDRFVVSKWAPQYTTEQFVVLFRYNRHCERVPNAYWPKRQKILCPYENVQFFVHLHKIQTYDLQNWNFPFYPLGHCCPLLLESPPSSTYLQQPKTFSALYCWSIRASRMLNQHSLCSDTEKWYLCNNANKFVPINKHCFPQIFV